MKLQRAAALMIVCVLLFSQAFAERTEDALITYGDRVLYTAEDGESMMQSEIILHEGTMDERELQRIREDVIQTLKDQAVMMLKYEELGLDQVSDQEMAMMESNARNAYESMVSQIAEQLREAYGGTEEKSLVTARALLDQANITYELIEKQIFAQWRTRRLGQAAAGDIQVTDEEIEAIYREEYVEPDRAKYQGNITAFEEEVFFGNGSSAYIPGGYRLVQWIVIRPKEELAQKLQADTEDAEAAYEEAVKAYEATYGVFENDDALQQARQAYDTALEAYSTAAEKAEITRHEVLKAAAETVEEVRRKYEEGTSFDDLIRQYSADQTTLEKPYPIHAESRITDPDLKEIALSIENVGDISDANVMGDGIWLVLWVQELPEGAAELEEETRAVLKDLLLTMKQTEKVAELLPEWYQEFEITAWPERLTTPEK